MPIAGFEPSFFILFIYFRLIDFLIFQKKEGLKAFTEVSFFLYSVGGGWTFPALINCFPCSFGLFFLETCAKMDESCQAVTIDKFLGMDVVILSKSCIHYRQPSQS